MNQPTNTIPRPAVVGDWPEIQDWLREIGIDPTARFITDDGIRVTVCAGKGGISTATITFMITADDVRAFPLR